MAWDFLYIVRREYHGDNNWGEMYMQMTSEKWQWLSYTYELPWTADDTGKSINNRSRVEMGVYELHTRSDGLERRFGGKGWRLELLQTGHRGNIQIHRAAASMGTRGCILPVHFNTLQGTDIKKGNDIIGVRSSMLMDKIQARCATLMASGTVNSRPRLCIAATLPAELLTDRSHAHA